MSSFKSVITPLRGTQLTSFPNVWHFKAFAPRYLFHFEFFVCRIQHLQPRLSNCSLLTPLPSPAATRRWGASSAPPSEQANVQLPTVQCQPAQAEGLQDKAWWGNQEGVPQGGVRRDKPGRRHVWARSRAPPPSALPPIPQESGEACSTQRPERLSVLRTGSAIPLPQMLMPHTLYMCPCPWCEHSQSQGLFAGRPQMAALRAAMLRMGTLASGRGMGQCNEGPHANMFTWIKTLRDPLGHEVHDDPGRPAASVPALTPRANGPDGTVVRWPFWEQKGETRRRRSSRSRRTCRGRAFFGGT